MYNYDRYLVNEELRHVDPYSPDLTDKEKRLILLECKLNYSYFVDTIIFIYTSICFRFVINFTFI